MGRWSDAPGSRDRYFQTVDLEAPAATRSSFRKERRTRRAQRQRRRWSTSRGRLRAGRLLRRQTSRRAARSQADRITPAGRARATSKKRVTKEAPNYSFGLSPKSKYEVRVRSRSSEDRFRTSTSTQTWRFTSPRSVPQRAIETRTEAAAPRITLAHRAPAALFPDFVQPRS